MSIVSPCALVANEDRDFFQILVNNFIHCWGQWQRAMDRFQMVRRDVTQLKSVVWKLSRKTSKVSVSYSKFYQLSDTHALTVHCSKRRLCAIQLDLTSDLLKA